MSDYVPSVERVRRGWIHHRRLVTKSRARDSGEEFDRMIAEVERAAAVKALEEAADMAVGVHAYRGSVEQWAGREISGALRARAAEVREVKSA